MNAIPTGSHEKVRGLADNPQASGDRQAYEAPELVDYGDMASLTQSAFVTAGSDSGYS